ncbi:MAG: hypothetical protein H7Y36_07000 [Armatimonadetes bacterium]|nr:hypothetical protein [Akkermansiaceae bacterium]
MTTSDPEVVIVSVENRFSPKGKTIGAMFAKHVAGSQAGSGILELRNRMAS